METGFALAPKLSKIFFSAGRAQSRYLGKKEKKDYEAIYATAECSMRENESENIGDGGRITYKSEVI
jgi:hypothetical protein